MNEDRPPMPWVFETDHPARRPIGFCRPDHPSIDVVTHIPINEARAWQRMMDDRRAGRIPKD